MKNPSFLLFGPLEARIEDRPEPEISSPHDVIVRIAYTGVCGSDVHFWLHGGIRTHVSQSAPLTMGHEASGVISAVGSAVTRLAVGDRVAIEPGTPCRRCQPCKAGRYNLCPSMAFAADPPHVHGTLTRYFAVAEDFCYKVPDAVSLAEAVLLEPLAVAVHSVRLADVRPGHKVIVFGAGAVGLFCAAVAREFGASTVLSVDLLLDKLTFAQRLVGGAVGRVAVPDASLSPESNAQRMVEQHGFGFGADVVIDATGAEPSVQTAVYSLRPGGAYVQTGMGKRKIEFPIAEVCEKELVFKGCFRYGPGDFDLALELVSCGKIGLRAFISEEFAFEDAIQAWEATQRGEGIKNVIKGPSE